VLDQHRMPRPPAVGGSHRGRYAVAGVYDAIDRAGVDRRLVAERDDDRVARCGERLQAGAQ